jgi:hypothetical protein
MSTQKDTKTRRPRLPGHIYKTTNALAYLLYITPDGQGSDEILLRATRAPIRILATATHQKLPDPDSKFYGYNARPVIIEAMRSVYTFTENGDPIKIESEEAAQIFTLFNKIEKAVRAAERRAAEQKQGAATTQREKDKTWHVDIISGLPGFGVNRGDVLKVAEGGAWEIGDFVCVEDPNGRVSTLRVCDRDDRKGTVHLVSHKDEYRTIKQGQVWGVVVKHIRRHADEIEKLKKRLDRIDRDDITDSTARYQVEREIYNLEHPQDEVLDTWEWPDEVDG